MCYYCELEEQIENIINKHWALGDNTWKTFGNPNFQKNPISGWELTRIHPLSSVVIGPVVTSNSGKTFLIIMSKEFESSSFHNYDGMGDSLVIYLWRNVVCFVLFRSYEFHRTRMLQIVFLVSFKSSQRGGGAWAWFHGVWTCDAKVLEYWMISSLKIKLNRN